MKSTLLALALVAAVFVVVGCESKSACDMGACAPRSDRVGFSAEPCPTPCPQATCPMCPATEKAYGTCPKHGWSAEATPTCGCPSHSGTTGTYTVQPANNTPRGIE